MKTHHISGCPQHFRLLAPTLLVGVCAFVSNSSASSDYGPAIWRQACSGHWYTSGVGKQFYVEHDMEGYYASTISYLQGCNNSVSIHYCVNGKQDTSTDMAAGEITQMVLDAYYAWHVGCWNTHCMGTEHEGFVSNPAWFTESMYQASAALTRSKSDKYGFAKDRNHIVGHNEHLNSAWRTYAASAFGIDPTCNTHTDPGPYWDWNHFMALVNPPSLHLDAFVRGTDNQLWHKYYDVAYGWKPGQTTFEALGGTLASDPAAVCWGNARIDLFYKGTDATLQHRYWTPSGWSAVESLGGGLAGKPAASSRGLNKLDVFVRGTDNALYHKWYDGGVWYNYENLGGTLASDPTAVSWSSDRIDVFYKGTDGTLQHRFYTSGTGWSGVESLGGGLTGAPAVSSWSANRLDVFIRGTDNALWHRVWDTTSWSAWESLGGTLTSDPGAVSGGFGRIDVFMKGTDNAMWHKSYSGGWSANETLGGSLVGAPGVSSWSHTN